MRKLFLMASVIVACAPRAAPLKGVLAPDRSLPTLSLPVGHRHVVFRWDYEEGDIAARGDGSVRIASPDSARLDFFLGGGMGGGAAILIGDSLRAPHVDVVRRYIPAPPMMWAVLGRLAIPALPDTVVKLDGDIVRADVGRPVEWRLAARADTLLSLEHISSGKIVESVSRGANGTYTFQAPAARRTLRLTVLREEPGSFDASIWSL
jgi:hypothetical protein